jgi:6,7-dimethyl-8-ribityllumazine synthase
MVVSRFNSRYTDRLRMQCLKRLGELGLPAASAEVTEVPGAFELPLAAQTLAAGGRFQAVLCLGAILRGATSHYDLVCAETARGIQQAGLTTGVPVIFGVITCDTAAQALERCSGGPLDAGRHAAEAALWMAGWMEDERGKP